MRRVAYVDVGFGRRVEVESTDDPEVVVLRCSVFGITPGKVSVGYLKDAARLVQFGGGRDVGSG